VILGIARIVVGVAIGILTLIFCWKLVPETKGKHLEDVQAYFQARLDRRKAP
jgi:hypothetical protein